MQFHCFSDRNALIPKSDRPNLKEDWTPIMAFCKIRAPLSELRLELLSAEPMGRNTP